MLRAYLESDTFTPGMALELDATESRHLTGARRARTGDSVALLNGRGLIAQARLTEASPRRASLEVESVREAPRPATCVTLAVAIPKGKTMDLIVRTAVELGASRIVPLLCDHGETQFDERRETRKVERWRTDAIEALKQSGNPWLPEIRMPQSLGDFIHSLPSHGARCIAALTPETQAFAEVSKADRLCWLVGPEGDFSPREYQAAQAAGFLPVSLGPHVLRTETACTAALALSAQWA